MEGVEEGGGSRGGWREGVGGWRGEWRRESGRRRVEGIGDGGGGGGVPYLPLLTVVIGNRSPLSPTHSQDTCLRWVDDSREVLYSIHP